MKLKFLLAFLIIGSQSFSQAFRKYSNNFLEIGVGARAQGMSGAMTSYTSDLNSAYWNPAGLVEIPANIQVGAMHTEGFAGIIKYDHAGLAAKLDDKSFIGVNVIRLGVDGIPNTIDLIDANGNTNYSRIKYFSVADYAFIFSYAKKLKNEKLQFGGNAKIIRRTVGDFGSAWGFGLDAGIKYKINKWLLSAVLKDFPSTFNAWSYTLDERSKQVFTETGNSVPENSIEVTLPRFIIGSGYGIDFSEKLKMLTAIDFELTSDGARNVLLRNKNLPFSVDGRLGIELAYNNLIYLRTGLGNFQNVLDENNKSIAIIQPNFGLGLKLKKLSVDYALTSISSAVQGLEDSNSTPYSNVISLKFDIVKKN